MPNKANPIKPLLLPLGDSALLIKFGDTLTQAANVAAIATARLLSAHQPPGAMEIVPGLVSVLVRYDRAKTQLNTLRGEVRLLLERETGPPEEPIKHRVTVTFDGDDLAEVTRLLGLSRDEFVSRHDRPLRVLATGFAPGFVYCGLHDGGFTVPRRTAVRPHVPAGTVLFAARQTAIASTPIRTGWHVIGRTSFQNFIATADPPTKLRPGDLVQFEDAS
ncbi:MAG: carboxyltransferase domain-containing protein [Devosia sp.]